MNSSTIKMIQEGLQPWAGHLSSPPLAWLQLLNTSLANFKVLDNAYTMNMVMEWHDPMRKGKTFATSAQFDLYGFSKRLTLHCGACPHTQMCVHKGAALIKIQRYIASAADPTEPWTKWAKQAQNAELDDPYFQKAKADCDVVTAEVYCSAGGTLIVDLYTGRTAEVGKKAKAPVPLYLKRTGEPNYTLAETIPSHVQAAAFSLMHANPEQKGRGYIKNRIQLSSLKVLIEEGICTLGGSPLRWGPELLIETEWVFDEELNHYKLTNRMGTDALGGGKAVLWRVGTKTGYLSTQNSLIGLTEYDNPLFADYADRAPPIPEKLVEVVSKALAKSSAAIPLPRRRAKPGELTLPAKPVLALEHHTVSARGRRKARSDAALRPQVRYGNHLLPLAPGETATTVETPEGNITLLRDTKAESQFAEALVKAGLHALPASAETENLPDGSSRIASTPGGQPLLPGALARKVHTVAALINADVHQSENYPYKLVETDQIFYSSSDEDGPWLSIGARVKIGEHHIDLIPAFKTLLATPGFSLKPLTSDPPDATIDLIAEDGITIRAPLARIRQLVEPLADLIAECGPQGIRISRAAAGVLEMTEERPGVWEHKAGAQKLSDAWEARTKRPLPELDWTMWEHQVEGFYFLAWLSDSKIGGIIADEPGAGKTAQVISHLMSEKQLGRLTRPALIVFTKNAHGVWLREFATRGKGLNVVQIRNSARKLDQARIDALAGADVLVCTYGQLSRGIELLKQVPLSIAVPDEAHNAKGYTSVAARALRQLNARVIPTTGTPLENNLGELFTLIDMAAPGLLGTRQSFNRIFRNPIEKMGDQSKKDLLRRRIKPLLLRRLKKDVFKNMPPKRYSVLPITLGPQQRELYESLRAAASTEVRAILRDQGNTAWKFQALTMLTKLRQVCSSPKLLPGIGAAVRCTESAKEDAFAELIRDYIGAGRKILVTSVWTKMLDLLQASTDAMGIESFRIDGDTKTLIRTEQENRFQAGERSLFYLSTKAGGASITLTEADMVIHATPWYNPKSLEQAEDRAHRGDQLKQVDVIRLVIAGSVEERILDMNASKNNLASSILDDDESSAAAAPLTREDFENLLRPIDEENTLGDDAGQDQELDDDDEDEEAA